MGWATVALLQNQFTYGNPAAHDANGLNFSFGASRMTGWSGGDVRTAGILSETGSFQMGAGVWRFGDEVYNRQMISGLLAHGIGHTRLGLRIDLNQFNADGQSARHNLAFTAGGMTSIHSRLTVGAFAENLGAARLYGKPMAIRFSAGIGARPVPQLSIVAAVMQEIRSPASWSAGLEYAYRNQVHIRMGVGLYPYRLSAGVGFMCWRVQADFATAYAFHTGISLLATASVHLQRSGG